MTVVGIVAGSSGGAISLHRAYVDAVVAAGGVPLLVPASFPKDDGRVEQLLDMVGALLLAGGGDVDPGSYGARPVTTLDHVDPLRDAVELRALRWARASGVRVLGVCRGAQLLAVSSGGTLVQDLPAAGFDLHIDVRNDREYAGLRHVVKTLPGSLAERLLRGLEGVNSHHHQGVMSTGNRLVATAWSPDGVIEAVEGPDVLGVQWHPETGAMQDARHLRPFQWLVNGEAEWKS